MLYRNSMMLFTFKSSGKSASTQWVKTGIGHLPLIEGVIIMIFSKYCLSWYLIRGASLAIAYSMVWPRLFFKWLKNREWVSTVAQLSSRTSVLVVTSEDTSLADTGLKTRTRKQQACRFSKFSLAAWWPL